MNQNGEYTKHYYAGTERVLSKISCGGLDRLNDPLDFSAGRGSMRGMSPNGAALPPDPEPDPDPEPEPEPEFTPIEEKQNMLHEQLNRTVHECLEKGAEIIWDNLVYLRELEGLQCEEEKELYFYHPDHLGSGTWITYTDGSAIQHLHYLPFGEEQIDQRLTSFNSRYTFSAKEKDVETGYSYFGARYYNSELSIWLSVDPMSDKYPILSPYSYCANNPIKLVDPNGEDIWEVDETGRMQMTKQQDGNDVLISKKTGKQQELSGNGVIAAAYSDTKDENSNITSTTLNGLSRSDARATFNFLGANTTSEWGRMETKDADGNSHFTVGSDFNPDGESFIYNKAMDAKPGSVLRYDHSHSPLLENSSGNPSTFETSANKNKYSDVDAWGDLIKIHPQINLGISYKGKTTLHVRNGEMPGYLQRKMKH